MDPQPEADVTELDEQIAAGAFWRLVPECVPREYAEPTRPLVERVYAGLERLAKEAEGAQEHSHHWERGDVARDLRTDRVGHVMGHVGPYYQLRPLTGGKEWEAFADNMVPAQQSDAMLPQVREANRRSRDHLSGSW